MLVNTSSKCETNYKVGNVDMLAQLAWLNSLYLQVKLYEAVLPWKHENREMKTRVRSLGDELHKCCTELQNCKDVSFHICVVYSCTWLKSSS